MKILDELLCGFDSYMTYLGGARAQCPSGLPVSCSLSQHSFQPWQFSELDVVRHILITRTFYHDAGDCRIYSSPCFASRIVKVLAQPHFESPE